MSEEQTVTSKVMAKMVEIQAASVQVMLERAHRPKEHDIISKHALSSLSNCFQIATDEQWNQLRVVAEELVESESRTKN